jgi:vacuolar-type H+-ATPase subunit E/Vma4
MPYFNNNEDAYRLFSREINAQADEKIEALRKEIKENKDRNIRKIENELNSRVSRNLEIDLNDLNADFSANLSKVKNEYTRVLMSKRKEMLDSIVETAKNKCIDFVNGKEYKTFLISKIKEVNERFTEKEVEFRVKKDDSIVKELINKNFNGKYQIKEINEIEIGGFLAICFDKGFMLDETIDSRLKEKRQWFYEHSELAAK